MCVRMHKVIYKFMEDVRDFVHDAREQMESKREVEVVGRGTVLDVFEVTETAQKKKHKKVLEVGGCRVKEGVLDRKHKYRVVRNGKTLSEELKVHSMKKQKEHVA